MAMGGYAGKILFVDLSRKKFWSEKLLPQLTRDYIGGSGLNYQLARDLIHPRSDPLAPESPVIIGVGPLVGLPVPSAAKFQATVRFPNPADESGKCFIGSASSGSRRFAAMLKKAGFDCMVITGRSERPAYLVVENGGVKLEDASGLWGKTNVYQTTRELMKKYPGAGVIAIGAAGENLVRFAIAITDMTSTLGRNGLGAVLGSKKLKAIVVRGEGEIKIADRKRLLEATRRIREEIEAHPLTRTHREIGLHASWHIYRITMNPGLWPVEKWDCLYGPAVARSAILKNLPCSRCILCCRSSFPVEGTGEGVEVTHTGTFLHLATIGQTLNLEDWRQAARLLHLCNCAGMSVVEFRGIIRYLSQVARSRRGEVEALKLEEGLPAYERLLNHLIFRQGIGNILAEGWVAMGRYFGEDPANHLSMIKGAACTYDARATKMDAPRFNMVVNPRGAMHGLAHSATSIPLQEPEVIVSSLEKMGLDKEAIERIIKGRYLNVGRLTRHVQDSGQVMDCLGVCIMYNIPGFLHLQNLAKIYSAATGLQTTAGELKRAGERVFNLLKVLNVREGFHRDDDSFPKIWLTEKNTPDGKEYLEDYYRQRRLEPQELQALLDDYYQERGWDPLTGCPTPETLAGLGLGRAAESL
ncbi:aldehyde:ferredoxin oxidoreductase [Desulfofundulus luciae]|uniref:Aldehyde:ferredoxin oxidoreductase n=1 Tax=Desulfofundulus luciae TaxID=74702 RepID=A0ABU0B3K6_9FIRM|nr:aldehyde ferredoxin oxidoreductase N-terminal domain-containing protein [Desulfofundulus luciae]MDQ0287297.1 aldehyde:ferredoxin oxidoreductase [Desulfofundulus luciae]